MPTRKQRRRRQKGLRHEWEEVYVDAEGRELPPEEVEGLVAEPVANGRREREAPARRSDGAKAGPATREPRGVKPPSWKRVFKRTAIFAPLMYLFIAFTSDALSPVQEVLTTVWLLLVFVPFSYLMDRFTYGMWKRRMAKTEGQPPKRRRA